MNAKKIKEILKKEGGLTLKTDGEKAFLLKQAEYIADAKAEEAEKWLRDFREVWERVPERIKESIRKTQSEIKSKSEADYFLATLRLLAA